MSHAVTVQLFCVFVFAYSKCQFSPDAAQTTSICLLQHDAYLSIDGFRFFPGNIL